MCFSSHALSYRNILNCPCSQIIRLLSAPTCFSSLSLHIISFSSCSSLSFRAALHSVTAITVRHFGAIELSLLLTQSPTRIQTLLSTSPLFRSVTLLHANPILRSVGLGYPETTRKNVLHSLCVGRDGLQSNLQIGLSPARP